MAKDSFDSMELGYFWLQIKYMYPLLSKEALKLLIQFSTTYLCEAGFFRLFVIKTKTRNKLELKDDLRCFLPSNLHPDVNEKTTIAKITLQ